MPLRKPRPGEAQPDYMSYCVPIEIDSGRPQKQAVAICLSMYRRKELTDNQESNMKEITILIDDDEGTAPSWGKSLVTDGKDLQDWEKDFLLDLSLADDTKAIMKTEGDGKHPSSHYLVVTDPAAVSTWHLRVQDTSGKLDHRLLGAAHAALLDPKGYRGNKYAGPNKAEAIAKLKRLYARENMPLPGGEKATRPGSLAQTTESEEHTVTTGMTRQIGQAIINAVSGLIKGDKKEIDDEADEVDVEDVEDKPPTDGVDDDVDSDDEAEDSFDETTITWLDEEQASKHEAPDGYKILGTIGDGDDLEFVLEPLEKTKEVNVEEEDKDDRDDGDDGDDSTGLEDKAGRRVRSTKLDDLRRLKKEITEALQALDAVIGWAGYDDEDKENESSSPFQWMSEKSLKALEEHGSVAFSFKAKDGSPWWMQWTMNSFKDREGEIFSTKSISDYVSRHESDNKKGEFWFWHVPGSKFGDVRWEAQVGRFLVQAGPFGDDPVATRFKQFFDDYPDGHPDIAPYGWGTSHRYEYKSQDRQDSVYDWFELKESTVLPWHEASNPWSPRPTQVTKTNTMEVTVNEKQKDALREIGGDEFVALIEHTGQARTKELEASAIDYKADGSYASRIRSLAAKCGKADVKVALNALCKELDKQYPPMHPDEDEDEESKESKAGSKANTLEDLGEKLHLIAGKAGGEVKAALDTIAKEMTGSEKETGKEAKADAPAGQKDVDPRYVTKDDFKGAIGALVETIRSELTDGLKAIQDEVAATQEQVQTTREVIQNLSRSDEAKIAEKAEGVPTASLESIMDELLGTDTRIKTNSKLAKKKPQQTDQVVDGMTGVPGLDWMIAQPNQ